MKNEATGTRHLLSRKVPLRHPQIGEFSFILAGLGITLGVLSPEGRNLILAGALLSITVNPLVFHTAEAIQGWRRTPVTAPAPDQRDGKSPG